MKRIYLDHNATSPVRPEVAEKIQEVLSKAIGNPNSIHASGRLARDYIDQARVHVANLVGSKASDIIFTSGGTESNHLAWKHTQSLGKAAVAATSKLEHPCVLAAAREAEKQGNTVVQLEANAQGELNWQPLLKLDQLDFCSIHHANNEVGVVWDIQELSHAIKAKFPKCILHTDAVQCGGKLDLDVGAMRADYLTLSGHKLGALGGTGALYRQLCTPIEPLWEGGPQEKGRRGGTENVLGIVAMGEACRILKENGQAEAQRILIMRKALEEAWMNEIPEVEIPAQKSKRLCNTFGMIFNGVDAEALLIAADMEGIDVSTGSACSSGSVEPSHVYLAMGYSEMQSRSALRFSLGWNTIEDDIHKLIDVFPKLVSRARDKKLK